MARRCQDWIKSYINYTIHSEAPDVFHFWTGVSTIAGALRRRVWIEQHYFQWTPNFYIFFVAPPGIVSKSTTADIGMRLLRQLDDIAFGPQVITWQSLVTSLAQAKEMIMMDDGMLWPMSCLTIAASELGTFFNPQDRELVDILVSLWDSRQGVFDKSTKTQGEDKVENPWLNIIGCTTPAWISENMPEYMIGGGFTSRSVFVYAENKRRLVAYPSQEVTASELEALEKDLVHDLREIAEMRGPYTVTPEAYAWGTEWYETHWTGVIPVHMSSERYGGYRARKQSHIHKLAMVLSAARSNNRVLDVWALQAAERIVSGLEHDMDKVFSKIGASVDSTRYLREIVGMARAYGDKATKKFLWTKLVYRMRSYDEFEQALTAAINAGLVKEVNTNGEVIVKYVHQEAVAVQAPVIH